ncbi:MAG TPA: exonuclease SbcCD subunit D [Thermodesulfobacteriota bacterium]|nr:exonuclease SbcCD subunit D [Thermodesulfobacteriota bacterium]
MRRIKFIHLSDIHIGLLTHGRLNPSTGHNTRLEDILKCLDHVLETAARESVDLILIAGDVFHRENPLPAEEIEFARRIGRAAGKDGTRVVMVLGNHDYSSSGIGASAVEIFPALDIEGVTIARKPDVIEIETKSGSVQVACLPWAGRGALLSREEYKSLSSQELLAGIERRLIAIVHSLAEKTRPKDPAILLAHVAARGARLSGTETDTLTTSNPVVPVTVLADPAFQYVALGHIHRFQDLNEGDAPPVVYSGSIERIDFTEEKEKKGFVMGEISESETGWKCVYQFRETPARRFITIDLGEIDEDRRRLLIPDGVSPGDTEGAVVRVRYEVGGPGEEVDEKEIRSAFGGAQSLRIERVFSKPKKTMRQSELSKNMSVLDALDKYVQSKPELKKIGAEMKSFAEKLIRENE